MTTQNNEKVSDSSNQEKNLMAKHIHKMYEKQNKVKMPKDNGKEQQMHK